MGGSREGKVSWKAFYLFGTVYCLLSEVLSAG